MSSLRIHFKYLALAATLAGSITSGYAAPSGVLITEWQYNGSEFVEFTNFGPAAVSFAGWSFDDDSNTPGAFDLSGFGVVASGQSVIMSEVDAAAFRLEWNLDPSIKVVGNNSNNGTNLGRNDVINLYNNLGTLVDRLSYNDQANPGTIRTLNISGRPGSISVLEANTDTATGWVLASLGDADNSYASASGNFIGSPGFSSYAVAAVPEPETYAMLLAGLGLIATVARRRQKGQA